MFTLASLVSIIQKLSQKKWAWIRKGLQVRTIGEEEVKLSLFAGAMILHVGVPERARNEFGKVEECKITNRLDGNGLILYSNKNSTFNQRSVYNNTV